MQLSASEQATIHFYEWEYLGRGYFHFNSAVDIEPPYRPFYFKQLDSTPYIDDGKLDIIGSVSKLFKGKEQENEIEKVEIVPNPLRSLGELKGFSLSFGREQDISSIVSLEFLNMLSYSDDVISFEIIANAESIRVQIVCSSLDEVRIQSHLKAYFPNIIIRDIEVYELFDIHKEIAIADFGYQDEYMRPIYSPKNFNVDTLTSIIASMEHVLENETALFQIMFKGVTAPWVNDIIYSVSDGSGGSFFSDSPEMLKLAQEKVSNPLFSVVMRIATQGNTMERSRLLAQELSRSISMISNSQYNHLIPLSNEGYDYENHVHNVFERRSNRLGMIMNAEELVSFVHYPNKTVVSKKLNGSIKKTKQLGSECINQKYVLGLNIHNGIEKQVSLNDKQRLQHTHIIGATGVGKSTLIANMLIEDMNKGNGCALFDPHGDIVDDILLRVPEHRMNDVIIIDPSDTEFPIGFNLLQAKTDVEKIVLSSDLVSAFKRHATAWGDNMTAVLSNAINTFLESEQGGTLIELKRFLIEDKFRNQYCIFLI